MSKKLTITKKEAKSLTLKLWKWLRDNPEKDKGDSPYWREVNDMICECPLCEYNNQKIKARSCSNYCPLYASSKGCDESIDAPWRKWYLGNKKTKREGASEIIEIVRKW